MTFLNESSLIEELKSGKESAVKAWYAQSSHRLLSFFSQHVGSNEDAQELMHDTLMSCLSSFPLFRGKSGLYTWMMGIARHELADYWRKKYAKKVIAAFPFGEELISNVVHPETSHFSDLSSIISRLPEDMSEILQLKYIDGLSVKELALRFGVSVSAMQSRLYRAKEIFAAEYKKDFSE